MTLTERELGEIVKKAFNEGYSMGVNTGFNIALDKIMNCAKDMKRSEE